jgi:protein-tyrosine phosphatase
MSSRKTVLFLCTGNYYRSRFAEILFNAVAVKTALPWRADSRGLALEFGVDNLGPMSADTVQGLQARGISIEGYQRLPQQVRLDDLTGADRIVALKQAEHGPLLRERFPDWAERVEYWHIHDTDCGEVDEALAGIEKEVLALVERLRREGTAAK